MTAAAEKEIVLIGGGHTHALVLHGLKTNPLKGATVTVINPGKTAPYSGMLPGFVAGHYQRSELDIDLEALSAAVGATLINGFAAGMDPEKKHIRLQDGSTFSYDLASIDVGITSDMKALPGFAEYGVPAKPLAVFAEKWDAFRNSKASKSVVIIGGGIAGAELAMAIAFALRSDPADVSVKLLDRSNILSANSAPAQKHVRRELASNAVEVLENVQLARVRKSDVLLENGEQIASNFTVGAAGATPHAWIERTGLRLHRGFIEVDAKLQSSAPGVFAVGDCAHMTFDPRPKAGVFAVRQAPVLLTNLRHALIGTALQSYAPQRDYLKLVSLGSKRAFAEKRGWGVSGRFMWRVKDKIDRDFMAQF